jgi:hypothetical protein
MENSNRLSNTKVWKWIKNFPDGTFPDGKSSCTKPQIPRLFNLVRNTSKLSHMLEN